MSATLNLRLRTPKGQHNISLDLEMLWIDVLHKLEEVSGIPANQLRLLRGYPPKAIEAEEDVPLRTLNLPANECLICQAGEARVLHIHSGERYIPPAPERAHFIRRICPADNSCLFHACAYLLKQKSRVDGPSLRALCAEVIESHPDMFNRSTIGEDPRHYANSLRQPTMWGGAIEIQVMSFWFQTELVALDLESCNVCRFGQGEGYSVRAFLVYTGQQVNEISPSPSTRTHTHTHSRIMLLHPSVQRWMRLCLRVVVVVVMD